jgi:hypothetical protein
MADLVIGCPVSGRGWVIDRWYEHAVVAAEVAGLDVEFVLVGSPSTDSETFDTLFSVCKHPVDVVEVDEPTCSPAREWGPIRYGHMVGLRNQLLACVQEKAPPLFLSLDSDILLHPKAISCLLDFPEWDAVGGKAYMVPPPNAICPSYAILTPGGSLRRPDATGAFLVDVIMAIKLMKPSAYAVTYKYDQQGEDIGWSKAARSRGCKLGWTGEITSKHVMTRDWLDQPDPRCGY